MFLMRFVLKHTYKFLNYLEKIRLCRYIVKKLSKYLSLKSSTILKEIIALANKVNVFIRIIWKYVHMHQIVPKNKKRCAVTVSMLIAVTHLFRWWAADSGTLFARFPNLDMLTGGAVIMPRIFSPCARSSRIVRRGRAAQPSRQLCWGWLIK